MTKIKFKNILKEAAWDHTSGKALPTLDDVQKAYEAKKHLQEEELQEGPNAWKRMDGLHNLRLMKQIKTNAATLVKEFDEEGFGEEDIRAWFDRELIKVIKKNT
tara:strand:+ start:412 stop:723 length:312 start_codon:yes stop_codon:yes gene_type:complete